MAIYFRLSHKATILNEYFIIMWKINTTELLQILSMMLHQVLHIWQPFLFFHIYVNKSGNDYQRNFKFSTCVSSVDFMSNQHSPLGPLS